MIEPLHGGEVLLLGAATGARSGAALPSSESASADAYARHGLLLISRIAGAPAERAAELLSQPLRPAGAEVDDGFALHVLARVIVVIGERDRKSTRLNSSHSQISYAVFCLK